MKLEKWRQKRAQQKKMRRIKRERLKETKQLEKLKAVREKNLDKRSEALAKILEPLLSLRSDILEEAKAIDSFRSYMIDQVLKDELEASEKEKRLSSIMEFDPTSEKMKELERQIQLEFDKVNQSVKS